METKTNQSNSLFKKFGFVGIALCAICCALPIAGAVFSIGALTVLAHYFKWAGLIAIVLALTFFIIQSVSEKKKPACDTDCNCKAENQKAVN
jgi:hypothetical protein